MKVIDASVLVEYLIEGEYGEVAEEVVDRERLLWAPALIDAEVGQTLRRKRSCVASRTNPSSNALGSHAITSPSTTASTWRSPRGWGCRY